MKRSPDISPQRLLLDRWLAVLKQIPEIDLIWLEGSLAEGKETPASDIDICFAIADTSFHVLWNENRHRLMTGLGDYYTLIDKQWVRALTESGMIVELHAYSTGELGERKPFECEILFSRLPPGEPGFLIRTKGSPSEAWPDPEPMTPESVRKTTEMCLLAMAHAPAPFYNGEIHSARFILDRTRMGLLSLMYHRVGLRFSKRYKHFSEFMPQAFLDDLTATYPQDCQNPLDPGPVARAMLQTFAILGKHLEAMHQQVGGGFEARWYHCLFKHVENLMKPFAGQEA